MLKVLESNLADQAVLLYLDPFGLKGCEFDTFLPYISRDKAYSTEIIINVCVKAIHRLSCRNKHIAGVLNKAIITKQTQLSNALGGDFWKKHLLVDNNDSPDDRMFALMADYKNKIQEHLKYVCYCPVYEHGKSNLKYFILLGSRHIDAILLMNDIMFDAYWEHTGKTGRLNNESIISLRN